MCKLYLVDQVQTLVCCLCQLNLGARLGRDLNGRALGHPLGCHVFNERPSRGFSKVPSSKFKKLFHLTWLQVSSCVDFNIADATHLVHNSHQLVIDFWARNQNVRSRLLRISTEIVVRYGKQTLQTSKKWEENKHLGNIQTFTWKPFIFHNIT